MDQVSVLDLVVVGNTVIDSFVEETVERGVKGRPGEADNHKSYQDDENANRNV